MIPDGVWPVMVTPFLADRSIDWDALDRLIEWYLGAGVAGLFAVCLSSEMFDLEADERIALAERVVRRVDGRVPVAASGTFGQTTADLTAGIRRMADTGEIPLGLYECPRPYRRLLTPLTLSWAASSGRFHFFKETSGQLALIGQKLEVIRGTPLRLLDANAATLPESLRLGGAGFCGVSTNFVPDLWTWLCRHARSSPGTAGRLHQFLLGIP